MEGGVREEGGSCDVGKVGGVGVLCVSCRLLCLTT